MSCGTGYVSTPLTTLFGTAARPSESAPVCIPDTSNSCDDAFNCLSEFTYDWKIAGPALAQGLAQGLSAVATQGLSIPLSVAAQAAALNNQPELSQAISWAGKLATTDFSKIGDSAMAFWDDFSLDFGNVSGVVDFATDIFDDVSFSDVLSAGTTAFQTYNEFAVPVAARGPSSGVPAPRPGTGQGGILGPMIRGGPTVGRSFFQKWPNLATAIQKMRNAGQNVSRSKLYSMLKRFGPDFLVTAGILTAAGVSELALAGPGHRRMNPANSKALRRAQRRLKSFHRLCADSDVLKSRRRSCAKKC